MDETNDDKYAILFEYFRQCPYLKDMMSIAANTEIGNTVILPQGGSELYQYIDEHINVNGDYECTKEPYPSVYEDYRIVCFELYDPNDTSPPSTNQNVWNFQRVASVCDWVREQDEKRNYPDFGKKIVSIEALPFVPSMNYVYADINTTQYYISVRIRFVNTAKRAEVFYNGDEI